MSAAWLTRSLGEVVAITKGRKPPRLISDSSSDSFPYATAEYFRSGIATQFVPSTDLASCVLTRSGCPVLIWDGSNAGEVFVGKDAVLASTMALIRPDDSVLDEGFCYFFLKTAFDKLSDGTTGSTIPHVSKHMLTALQIPILPLPEQRLISSLLFKLESAIALQAQLSDATAEIKRAAMRELFTRGLRGEPQKETEIGPVPESWETRTILDLCEIWSGGTPRKSVAEYWKGDIPWVSGKDLKTPALDDTIDHVSAAGVEAASRLAPAGAVLLLVRGMGLAKDLPVAVINRPMAFNQDVKALVSRGEYPGQFLRSAIYAGKDRLLSQIVPSAHGTMTLNLNDVETFQVACPTDPEEVAEIVAILDAIDRKIELHRKKRAVLEQLFKALLHKLMTGEIRVADLDLSALEPLHTPDVAA